jgi:hypothetical protein
VEPDAISDEDKRTHSNRLIDIGDGFFVYRSNSSLPVDAPIPTINYSDYKAPSEANPKIENSRANGKFKVISDVRTHSTGFSDEFKDYLKDSILKLRQSTLEDNQTYVCIIRDDTRSVMVVRQYLADNGFVLVYRATGLHNHGLNLYIRLKRQQVLADNQTA